MPKWRILVWHILILPYLFSSSYYSFNLYWFFNFAIISLRDFSGINANSSQAKNFSVSVFFIPVSTVPRTAQVLTAVVYGPLCSFLLSHQSEFSVDSFMHYYFLLCVFCKDKDVEKRLLEAIIFIGSDSDRKNWKLYNPEWFRGQLI